MDSVKQLKIFKKDFDQRLLDFLTEKEKEAKKITPSRPEDDGPLVHYGNLIKEIKRFVESGGKRLRPAFVFYGYKAVGGKNFKEVWPACLVVELIHVFALIHDDIMDNSELRRGQPTTWKLLGINQAILAGDLAFALAEELMSQLDLEKEKIKTVWYYFNLLKFEVIGGQYLDINKNSKLEEKEIIKIMDLKSGRYTIARPLQIGAAIAGTDKKILDNLFEYGVNLGIAFQIQDDILGTFGDEKVSGKPVGSDLKEGKRTLLVVKLKERVLELKSSRVLEKFERIFGNKELTKGNLQWVRKLMVKLQVLDYCQKKAVRLIKQAKKALQKVELDSEAKDFLLAIADYMVERRY